MFHFEGNFVKASEIQMQISEKLSEVKFSEIERKVSPKWN